MTATALPLRVSWLVRDSSLAMAMQGPATPGVVGQGEILFSLDRHLVVSADFASNGFVQGEALFFSFGEFHLVCPR